MASKPFQETRVNLLIGEGKEAETKVSVEETSATELMKENEEKNIPTQILVSQTYTFHEVSDETPIADFQELCPNVVEQANLINRAIVLKQQQFVRRMLTATGFQPVEGSVDLRDVIGQVSERKSASPEEKAANALSKVLGRTISLEDLAQIVGMMQSA